MIWGGYEAWKQRQMEQEEELKVEAVDMNPVTGWRFGYLCACGFDPATALKLAESKDVDLRKVDRLLEKGCSLEVAVEILL